MYCKKAKGHVSKSGDKKDICMSKSETDMCPFSYWSAREGNSECTGNFHQSPETKKKLSVEARALSRLVLKKGIKINETVYS